jgi:hypothetical protein
MAEFLSARYLLFPVVRFTDFVSHSFHRSDESPGYFSRPLTRARPKHFVQSVNTQQTHRRDNSKANARQALPMQSPDGH